ncbi:hypothetical protein OHR68_09985 [Spirillospora sp. NBC_00431]
MSTYPQIAAGQSITAGLLTSMLTNRIVKAANTDRVNNTLTADPELTAALEANAQYEVQFDLLVGGIPAADFATQWSVPASASGLRTVTGPGSTALEANADNITARLGTHTFATTVTYNGVRSATGSLFRVFEWAVVTTTSAGTCALLWAQGTTNATATRVAAGSIMRVRRIG